MADVLSLHIGWYKIQAIYENVNQNLSKKEKGIMNFESESSLLELPPLSSILIIKKLKKMESEKISQ